MSDPSNTVIAVPDISKNAGIMVCHWNSRSMFHKLEEVMHIAESSDCEFLCLSETWLPPDIPDNLIDIPGYRIIRQDRDSNSNKSRGGGVCIYHKSKLNVKYVDSLSFCSPDLEIVTVMLKLVNTRDIYLSTVYRPPDGNVPMFIETINRILGKMWNKMRIEYNIVDDVNIDWKDKNNGNTQAYKEFCKRAGLTNMITVETHYGVGAGKSSCIDHYLTSALHLYSQNGIAPFFESDHMIIFASRKKFKIKHD